MIKAMVVDDEALIRGKIVYLLNSGPIEFESVAEAGNGQEALQLMERGCVPDIVLTDIRMPVVDGLELIERVRAAYPDVRFVVISGYAEFEYAVKAMQFGVTGYVLKPVKAHELIGVVDSIAAEILENKRISFENRLHEWLSSRHRDGELRKELEGESDIFRWGAYAVSAIRFRPDGEAAAKGVLADMRSMLGDRPERWWLIENAFGMDGAMIVFGGKSEGELAQAAAWTTKRIFKRLQEMYGLTVTAGMAHAGELRTAYRSCAAALKRRFIGGPGEIYGPDPAISTNEDGNSHSFVFKVKLTEQRLENKNTAKAKAILLEFAEDTFIGHIADYGRQASIDYLFHEYVNIVIRYCLKNNIDFLEKIEQDVYTGQALDDLDDNRALVRLLSDLLDRIFAAPEDRDEGETRSSSAPSSVIDSIVRYIDRNIQEELTLQTISEKFAVNPSYLSRIFKAATGQGFVKYVTGRKIDKAKELLESGAMDIAAIAHGLGFSDQQYFNRVYKKTTGLTPNEWRARSKNSPKNA